MDGISEIISEIRQLATDKSAASSSNRRCAWKSGKVAIYIVFFFEGGRGTSGVPL